MKMLRSIQCSKNCLKRKLNDRLSTKYTQEELEIILARYEFIADKIDEFKIELPTECIAWFYPDCDKVAFGDEVDSAIKFAR